VTLVDRAEPWLFTAPRFGTIDLGPRSAELTAAALDLAARGALKPLIGQTI
jgi:hypothetical protein